MAKTTLFGGARRQPQGVETICLASGVAGKYLLDAVLFQYPKWQVARTTSGSWT